MDKYLINEPIQVVYQPSGAKTGLTATMEIYDETGAKDIVTFPDVTMTEIGTTGRYSGTFTPDAEGNWVVMIALADGKDKVVQQYRVTDFDIESLTDPPMVV